MLIIDRFEGNYAVCEDECKVMNNIDSKLIQQGAKEGDVIELVQDNYVINVAETEKRRKHIEELTENMWK